MTAYPARECEERVLIEKIQGVHQWGTLGQPQEVGEETKNSDIGTLLRALRVCVFGVGVRMRKRGNMGRRLGRCMPITYTSRNA